MRVLEEKRDRAEGMERIQYEYDLQMLREMRRDLKAAQRVCAASAVRTVKRMSLNSDNGAGLLADFFASQLAASLTKSRDSGGELQWLREVLADGLAFETPENRDILRLHDQEGQSIREIAGVLGRSRTAVSRRLKRTRERLRRYAADRLRLRRELLGEELDIERLLADLRCYERAPRQRQVLTLFFDGQRNFEIAIDLGLRPSHVSRTRKRGAEKLEVLGEDGEALKTRARHGKRALLGSWKIEHYGPNHQLS